MYLVTQTVMIRNYYCREILSGTMDAKKYLSNIVESCKFCDVAKKFHLFAVYISSLSQLSNKIISVDLKTVDNF